MVHILYDAVFADMRALETELLKMCSFYITKIEPVVDTDSRNLYPAVDRLKMLSDSLECEEEFQQEKLSLVMVMLECYEHTSDSLEQSRLIQMIVDETAKRPRINLSGNHFIGSYKAEVACLKEKQKLFRACIDMLIKEEYSANSKIREYLEKTYRLLQDQMENKWS